MEETLGSQEELISKIEKLGFIKSKSVVEALKAVDRKMFCKFNPYQNKFQINQNGAVVDQPSKVAEILELFQDRLKPNAKCLILGSENGYLPILMAHIIGTGTIVSLEYRKILRDESHLNVAQVSKTLKLAKIEFADFKKEDWKLGNEKGGPFNVIYASYIAKEIPQRIVNQLAPGGRFILAVGENEGYTWRCIDKTLSGEIIKRSIELQSEENNFVEKHEVQQIVEPQMGERRGSVHVNIPCPRQTQLKVIGDYHYAESKESLLGKGTFGHVWRCTRISDGFQAAVKVVCESGEHVENEIEIMRSLQSPYLLQLLDFKTQFPYIYIITEVCEMDLQKLIKSTCGLRPVQLKKLVEQMAMAYSVLHENSVLHRDVKPQNILISNATDIGFAAKLADFGIGKVLEAQSDYANTAVGTLLYMAPEVGAALRRRRASHYDSRADLWSFGLVFHECCTGERLMTEEMMEHLCEMAIKNEFWIKDLSPPLNAPADLCNLIQRMLVINYQNRLSALEFFGHPYAT